MLWKMLYVCTMVLYLKRDVHIQVVTNSMQKRSLLIYVMPQPDCDIHVYIPMMQENKTESKSSQGCN